MAHLPVRANAHYAPPAPHYPRMWPQDLGLEPTQPYADQSLKRHSSQTVVGESQTPKEKGVNAGGTSRRLIQSEPTVYLHNNIVPSQPQFQPRLGLPPLNSLQAQPHKRARKRKLEAYTEPDTTPEQTFKKSQKRTRKTEPTNQAWDMGSTSNYISAEQPALLLSDIIWLQPETNTEPSMSVPPEATGSPTGFAAPYWAEYIQGIAQASHRNMLLSPASVDGTSSSGYGSVPPEATHPHAHAYTHTYEQIYGYPSQEHTTPMWPGAQGTTTGTQASETRVGERSPAEPDAYLGATFTPEELLRSDFSNDGSDYLQATTDNLPATDSSFGLMDPPQALAEYQQATDDLPHDGNSLSVAQFQSVDRSQSGAHSHFVNYSYSTIYNEQAQLQNDNTQASTSSSVAPASELQPQESLAPTRTRSKTKKKSGKARRSVCNYVDPLTNKECGKDFNRDHDLARHRRAHSQYEAACVEDGRLLRERATLLPPEWDPTDDFKLQCRTCDTKFSRKDAVTRHERKYHGI